MGKMHLSVDQTTKKISTIVKQFLNGSILLLEEANNFCQT